MIDGVVIVFCLVLLCALISGPPKSVDWAKIEEMERRTNEEARRMNEESRRLMEDFDTPKGGL